MCNQMFRSNPMSYKAIWRPVRELSGSYAEIIGQP